MNGEKKEYRDGTRQLVGITAAIFLTGLAAGWWLKGAFASAAYKSLPPTAVVHVFK